MILPLSNTIRHEVVVRKRKSAEVRIAYTFALVLGVYVICWTPFTVNFLIIAYQEDFDYFQKNRILNFYNMMSICLSHFNSAANPFIYAYRIKDVREFVVKRIFKLLCRKFSVENVK